MIKITRTDYQGNVSTEVVGVGSTLFIATETVQVMSDVWEQEERIYYVTETGALSSACVPYAHSQYYAVEFAIDADFAALEKSIFDNQYKIEHRNALNAAESRACDIFVRGRELRINRGRKFPVGTIGKVVGWVENQWGISVGIALDDVTETVTTKNGKTYERNTNVIWVSSRNLVVHQPVFDQNEVNHIATSRATSYVENVRNKFNNYKGRKTNVV
jgi:hypothetical protein